MNLSIRLKLTLWYSLLMVLIIMMFVVVMNVIAMQQYSKTPQQLFLEAHQRYPELFEPYIYGERPIPAATFSQIIEEIRREDLAEIRDRALAILLVVAGASVVGGYVISGRLLSPLRKINDATRTITADNLAINVQGVNSNDELGELIENFNGMMKRLHQSFDLQKQFIENASHELKTPLTISQINLEALAQDQSLNRQDLKTYLENALRSTEFMNRLIEQLLLLSLTKEQIAFQDTNINEVIETAVTQLKPLAEKQSKVLSSNMMEKKIVRPGSATLLQRAVMNCIENAIRYAQKEIKISLTTGRKNIFITIHDDGAGIPSEHISKVSERFYRVDHSRSRLSGGSGLGLAITKSIVEKHGGTLTIQSEEGKGTTVTLLFPL